MVRETDAERDLHPGSGSANGIVRTSTGAGEASVRSEMEDGGATGLPAVRGFSSEKGKGLRNVTPEPNHTSLPAEAL